MSLSAGYPSLAEVRRLDERNRQDATAIRRFHRSLPVAMSVEDREVIQMLNVKLDRMPPSLRIDSSKAVGW